MSLDPKKLENVRELANGGMQARCPACAEGGHDRSGEHLRIYPDGRFGCAVNPKDREHRKRIFALAGDNAARPMTVKVQSGKVHVAEARSVASSLTGMLRTLRTGVSKSESRGAVETITISSETEDFRTLRTGIFQSRAYARDKGDHIYMCKDFEKGVLSVLSTGKVRLPHLTPEGTLVIPFDSPERYHWWKGGQSIAQTRAEILERKENDGSAF